jgi:ABC-2 type transport system ATP-binding protein
LSKSYGNINALKSLNLKVPSNSIFGFLGPNGAGKTTTMKLLLGLIQPSSGSGKIFGLDIIKDSIQVREKIGYLSQHPQFPKQKTGREILNFSLKFFLKKETKVDVNEKVNKMLDIVDLCEKADRQVGNLSGGELQRLGLAQAQIHEPDLLILDEPAASLDPIGRNDVLNVMKQLSKRTTIFYSTHILDDVQKVSDMVAILNEGKLVAQGTTESMLAGEGNIVYEICLKGSTNKVFNKLSSQTWVSNIQTKKETKLTKIFVTVNDNKIAEKNLLRLILTDDNIDVLDFHQKEYELEEVFMKLIKETT